MRIMHYHLPLHRKTQVAVLVAAHSLVMPTVLTVRWLKEISLIQGYYIQILTPQAEGV